MIRVPRVCRFTGGVRGDEEADGALLDGLLEVFAFDRGKFPAPEDAAFPGPGIDPYGLAWQSSGQFRGDPKGRVVILAKDNAAVFDPRFAVDPMLGKEPSHRCQFRVAGFRAGEFLNNRAEMPRLGGSQIAEHGRQQGGVVIIVLQVFTAEQLGGSGPS